MRIVSISTIYINRYPQTHAITLISRFLRLLCKPASEVEEMFRKSVRKWSHAGYGSISNNEAAGCSKSRPYLVENAAL